LLVWGGFGAGVASVVAFAAALTLAWMLHVMVEAPTHRMDKRIATGELLPQHHGGIGNEALHCGAE
jgi:peptidoglycan/LPS O-acetylase OafA/YrhL